MKIFTSYQFIVGLYHNILLIILFYYRKRNELDKIELTGKIYLIGITPLVLMLLIWSLLRKEERNILILNGLILLFVLLEILYDWILKIEFRSNWKFLVPYLILYYIANYAIVVLPWEENKVFGEILLGLMILQLGVNTWSHF